MNALNSSLGNETFPARRVDTLIIGGFNIFNTVFGIIGNSTVLLAVAFSKPLQTAFNVFIVNLAVADLLACLVLPLFLLSLWREYQPYLDNVCFVALAIIHTSIGCSIYTLASIAVNRFVLFIDPIKKNYYLAITKPSVFVLWISFIWIVPAFVSVFPPVALDIGRLSFDERPHICQSQSSYPTTELYETLLVLAFYPLPLAVLLIAYTGVFVQVLRHNRRLTKYTDNIPMSASDSSKYVSTCSYFSSAGSDSHEQSRKPGRKISKLQIKITRNMFIIFVAFVVCFTPHSICNFTQCKIAPYTRTLVTLNSMVNPILYGISHPLFRAFYGKVLQCIRNWLIEVTNLMRNYYNMCVKKCCIPHNLHLFET
ncbi:5-hydroxytryptamine receptor 1F [Holothuria leucospilota]|uniref:5-hydroxytryptamine receptor 1F n=1 Tax=Holothuria leucospilota TaxID=206669 RepID=A0A9Q1HDP7_HOLLE|nr:5-hydroxytryptamine receptor 1F [Holothuria leucospilota]